MNGIYIQKLNIKDIDNVLNIEKSHNISILSKKIIEDDLKSDNNYYIIAKENDLIIGYIGISYVLDTADIISIVVDKKYSRKGVASSLLEYIYNFCKEKNITKIMLEVRKSNISAQQLYLKQGFKQISIRKKYYDNTEDALIYEKDI